MTVAFLVTRAAVVTTALGAAGSDTSSTQPSLLSSIVGLIFFFGIAALIVWAWMRQKSNRSMNELRDRYARGEIDQAEFDARMDALRQER
jgi:hypothetical protein